MKREGVNIVATNKSGAEVDTSVLEASGTAFDPATVHLDLTKEEKRRTTALLLAIQAYQALIIKDAEMYNAVSRDHDRRNDGSTIQPATMDAMVMAALDFDDFISGKMQSRMEPGDPTAPASASPGPDSAGQTKEEKP